MSFSRKIVALATPLFLLGVFSMLGAQGASATSATHKALVVGNPNNISGSPNTYLPAAVETKAKLKFVCNSTTGDYTVTVRNFSVIGGDDTILRGTYDGVPLHIGLRVNGVEELNVPLTQNTTTELFDGSVTSVLSDKTDCHSAADFRGGALDTGIVLPSYNFLSPLS
jgi:hypothetical protein